ncbi:putative reverse transcriptase domain-containing protein [Tanacetum coccineum]
MIKPSQPIPQVNDNNPSSLAYTTTTTIRIGVLERDNTNLRGEIDELIAKHVVEALEAYDGARNPRAKEESKDNQGDDNGGDNGNGNGNGHKRGNGNGNPNVNAGGVKALMKLMTEVYCPRNEIQKMETELWNLTMRGNDLTTYNQRFYELVLLCTKMVLEEEDQVEKFIRGLSDNIQGNVIAAEPMRLQDAIRITNNLMDQKLKDYFARNAENKRRFDNNLRDNHV